MSLLAFLLRASRGTVALAIAAALLAGLGTAGVLVFIRAWMSRAAGPGPALLWGFVGVCLGALVSKLAAQLLLIGLSRRAVSRLLMHLSRGVLAAPLSHVEELGPARLQTVLTQDVQAIVQGLGALPLCCANLAIVAACLGYLGYLSPAVLLVVGGVLGAGLLLQLGIMRRAQRHFGNTREGQEALAGQLRHLLEGVKELKVHGPRREAFLEGALRGSLDFQERQGAASQSYLALADTVGRMVLFALLGLVLAGLPALGWAGRRDLGGYVLVVLFLMHPVGSLKYLVPQLARARAALAKVQALGLDLSAAAEPAAAAPPGWGPLCSLELAGVSYSYRRDRGEQAFTLGPLGVTFRPGEVVFLAGGNGSGKTTFAKVLAGLYLPRHGEVRVNGRAINADRVEEYRQLFTVVFSEFHLFAGLPGLPAAGLEAKAQEYLARFQLDRRLVLRGGAFSTTTRLSRGQRKRLALLVAYLEDRPFYVLDEWAADQDPHFRDVFYTDLLPDLRARGKAVLVITHDERYYHLADRLLFLEDGKLLPCPLLPAGGRTTRGSG
jgi:putative ATP-binding cassette transporter